MTDTQRLTEAMWALTNELALHRMQAEQGPSQTGAAFLIPGALVTVNNPRSEWYGMTGRVHAVGDSHTAIEFTDGLATWIDNNHLTKADDKWIP